ncbi:ribonuclease J, partial [Blautia obeum]|nr:ribonuclease J [Blautia obeum]
LKEKEILSGPDILSRGFVYMRESGDLINEGRRVIFGTMRRVMSNSNVSEADIRQAVIDDFSRFLYKETARKPMVLPMLIMI